MPHQAKDKTTEHALEKKYPASVLKAADRFLARSHLTLGELTRPQAELLLQHFRSKSNLKWFVIIAIIIIAIAGSATTLAAALLPQTLNELIKNQPQPEMIQRLAFGAAATGAVIALVLFSAAIAITTTVGEIVRARHTTRIIEEFLPRRND
ncbi:hypothetical protein STSP2_00545 [Anaerohalosphaera lusitana]|uniref:Uncharacterized protein n=1 Tax=Anaerohalosphaera lusitana TaxID=1936003 RepID=A0A1U9NHK3_9BACT|nr:hypothetical protein [Anaerohalosphaera lusitana]AQT67401.1 hypothetical protein STSP2_00545 [Anaerohalosphaera lusitana]